MRLHLDDCGDSNGPLRVSPGTHHLGIISRAEVANHVAEHGQINCLARKGGIILMRPLTLHASSQATNPGHRRVLHCVVYSGPAVAEPWHHSIDNLGAAVSWPKEQQVYPFGNNSEKVELTTPVQV